MGRGPGKGKTNNPKGRPKGSKNAVSNAYRVSSNDRIHEVDAHLTAKKTGLKECAEQDPKWFYEKVWAKTTAKAIELSGAIETTVNASDALMAKLNEIYVHTGRS